ncbi:hypothetical protein BGY98DRAFT_990954 [Russula aff. rugulosa BPL654]|nr:hypothetical protein BGY98DRAFT_990954 [Russula aff. rugulosa BPL654]
MGLVTLVLGLSNPSTYFEPNVLLQWISFMPQLERFVFSLPDSDLETQSTHTTTTTHITLPNLRFTYLEAVVSQITTPRLEKLEILFFEQPMFSVPHLVQFMNATENLKLRVAKFHFFDDEFDAELYPPVICRHFDRQVLSVTQIFNASSIILSAVEHLTLEQERDSESHEEQNAVDRNQWHNFLGSFNNVKIVRVNEGLVREISRSLRLDDGGVPLGLFPKLRELAYSGSGNGGNAITLGRRSPSRSESPSEGPTITSMLDDVGNDPNT